jgi:peptide/nickel transport system substrate-binding protein
VWTFTLRPGLVFHDGEPVRPADCIASLQRYMQKDPFMQTLGALVTEWKPLDDRRWTMALSKPFQQTVFAIALRNVFIMPERIAKTPPSVQFKEVIGSGPYRFLRDEWQSGAHAGYARFDKYLPRTEAPDLFSGGKIANFDHVDWVVQPDPATAAAALQRGEVDLLERPLLDLLPMLDKSPGLASAKLDTFGALAILRFNQLQPPFDNPKLRQALLPGIDQSEVVAAAVGDLKQYGTYPVGFFPAGTPMASLDGLDALTSKRDPARAKQLVAESGYKGERVVMLAPSDLPQIMAMSQVMQDQLVRMGLNVDFQVMDWGTMLSRMAKREPASQGGWNCFCVTWASLSVATPGSSYPLRGNGAAGWNGWPSDPKIEALRQQWFEASDTAAARAICREMQLEAMQSLPYIPLGQWTQPAAFTSKLTGLLQSPFMLFWNARKTA